MKQLIWIAVLISLVSIAARAQTPQPPAREFRGQGYAFVGPAAFTASGDTLVSYGGGGEGVFANGLGLGAEVAGFSRMGRFNRSFGALSPNVSYHFQKASKSGKLVPFVTGGYSLFFSSGAASGFNVGGGVNYWFGERVGMRIEVRDHVVIPSDNFNLISVRFGIAFR
jgi:hypothetical protein